jgi:hypothetical protein
MARQTNAPITFNDADYMVNNEGFNVKAAFIANSKCMTRSEIETHLHVNTSNFSTYATNQLVPYNLIQPRATGWRAIDPYCEQGDNFQLAFTTDSQATNYCLDRFRLQPYSGTAYAQLRKPDGTVLSTQLFHDVNASWTGYANYDHTFMFDLSWNTSKGDAEIWVSYDSSTQTFQQIYATDGHAGTAVRWGNHAGHSDPAAAGMVNGGITSVNFETLKFGGDGTHLWLDNQGMKRIIGGLSCKAQYIRINGNPIIPSADIDNLIIGCDNFGRTSGTLKIDSGKRTSTSTTAWNNLQSKGWTLEEV